VAADVIVIGAGWGGLTAGAILAEAGLEVQVLEATGHIGGRSACDRKDGFLVDYGIHIISYSSAGPAAKALRRIGHEIEFLDYRHPLLFVDGRFVQMPTGTASFLGSDILSFSEKMIIGHGIRKLVGARTARIADKPLIEAIPGKGREAVLGFYRVLSAMGLIAPDLEVASAGDFARFLRRSMSARVQISYPRGGASQINDALAARIRESGSISVNSRVKAIDFKDGKVSTVKVQDKEHSARAVIFGAPVQRLGELTTGGLPSEYRKKCASLIPTAGISIDLCLKRRVSDMDSCFITPDPIVMGQFTSNIDASTAPEGKQLATFFYVLPMETMNDKAALDTEQDRMLSLMDTMFPGMMDAVEWQRVLKLKMVDGFEPRVGQTDKDRPGTRVPDAENFFLAGDCVGVKGKGGDVAFTAGMAAADAVLEYLS
jgi:phytoene dehydrogenase-like protein